MTTRASSNFIQAASLVQRVVERPCERIAYKMQCVHEITFARPVGPDQVGQRTQFDVALSYALVVAENDSGDKNLL